VALVADVARITGRWVRHSPHGSPALPLRDPPPDNRWQRGAVVDALYLADHEQTAWAEWYRHLAELGVPPVQQLPRDLWSWQVDVEVADLSTAERLQRVDLVPPTPGRRHWESYQAVGEQIAHDGLNGLIAPSAARRGGLILCLFRRQPTSFPAGAEPVGPPTLHREPPAPPTGMRT
jgi:RES domain-containing protein